MGADLILTGFSTLPAGSGRGRDLIRAHTLGGLAALVDDGDAWLKNDDLHAALIEWDTDNTVDPGDSDSTGMLEVVLPGLSRGLDTYIRVLEGGERWLASWEILGGKAEFHTVGGSSWGDDPFEEWDDLNFFLNAAAAVPALAKSCGLLGFGVVVP